MKCINFTCYLVYYLVTSLLSKYKRMVSHTKSYNFINHFHNFDFVFKLYIYLYKER